jgi:hypothetical protein
MHNANKQAKEAVASKVWLSQKQKPSLSFTKRLHILPQNLGTQRLSLEEIGEKRKTKKTKKKKKKPPPLFAGSYSAIASRNPTLIWF